MHGAWEAVGFVVTSRLSHKVWSSRVQIRVTNNNESGWLTLSYSMATYHC